MVLAKHYLRAIFLNTKSHVRFQTPDVTPQGEYYYRNMSDPGGEIPYTSLYTSAYVVQESNSFKSKRHEKRVIKKNKKPID